VTKRNPPSPRIEKAVQMVAAQLGCDEDDAMIRLCDRAEYGQYRLYDYAQLVIDGIVKFDE
jgi:hypothetical protein